MIVDIPNIGTVEFPDSMSPENVQNAIQRHVGFQNETRPTGTISQYNPTLMDRVFRHGMPGGLPRNPNTGEVQTFGGLFTPSPGKEMTLSPNPQTMLQGLGNVGKGLVNFGTSPGGMGMLAGGQAPGIVASELGGPAAANTLDTLVKLIFAGQGGKQAFEGGYGAGAALKQGKPAGQVVENLGNAGVGSLMEIPALAKVLGAIPGPRPVLEPEVLPPENQPLPQRPRIQAPPIDISEVPPNLIPFPREGEVVTEKTPTKIAGTGEQKLLGFPKPPETGGMPQLEYSPEDLVEYNRLKQASIPTSIEQIDTPEFQANWKAFEQLRNKYGGMPPKNVEEPVKVEGRYAAPGELQQKQDMVVSELSKAVEGMKKVGGMVSEKARSEEKPALLGKEFMDKEKELRGPFVLNGPLEVADANRLGVALGKDGKFDGGNLYNRLQNKLKPSEKDVYNGAGLKEFLQTRRTPEEVVKWMQEQGPRVTVKKFGIGVMAPERKEYGIMRHEWYDSLSPTDRAKFQERSALQNHFSSTDVEDLRQRLTEDGWDKAKVDKAVRFHQLRNYVQTEPADVSPESNWQSIAPKDEQSMPGYVEIAVTKPWEKISRTEENRLDELEVKYANDTITSQELAEKNSLHSKALSNHVKGPQFPSSHNFPPNTLGFVRGYMEIMSDGKKVFHVIEAQSDWAQQVRDREGSVMATTPRAIEAAKEPLLKHWERLAMKAAIDHARSEGASAIAISDPETAMMTEGHDRVAQEDDGGGSGPMLTTQQQDELIEQSKGMRLHYGQILPKIVKELTGSEPVKVGFGEHRMAYENRLERGATEYSIVDPNGEERGRTTIQREANGLVDTLNRTEGPGHFVKVVHGAENIRKDLIFRNAKGEPKTDVTANMFSLEKVSKENTKEAQNVTKLYSFPGMLFDPDFYKKTGEELEKVWHSALAKGDQLWTRVKSNSTIQQVAYTADAADNGARIAQNNVENHGFLTSQKVFSDMVKGGSKEAKAKSVQLPREAVQMVLEAHNDKAQLQAARTKVVKNKEVLRAVDFALANWDRLQPLVKDAKTIDEFNLKMAAKRGIDIEPIEDYLKRIYQTSGRTTRSGLPRQYATIFDAVENGEKPLSMDYAVLGAQRTYEIARKANWLQWVDSFRSVVDKQTGQPLIVNLEKVKNKAGVVTDKKSAPRGYTEIEPVKGYEVAVLESYAPVFRAVFGQSVLEDPIGKVALEGLGVVKHGTLLFDSFHAFRIATFAKGFDIGAGYNKGLSVLEYSPKDLEEAEKQGLVPKGAVAWSQEKVKLPHGEMSRRELLARGVMAGLNIGRHSEALYSTVIRSLNPLGLGTFNRFVFDKLSRGAMAEAYMPTVEAEAKLHPEWTLDKVERSVARDINFRMGNIGRQGIFKNKTWQDVSRIAFLAPQWFESLAQSEGRALGQGAKAGIPGSGTFAKPGPLARNTIKLTIAFLVGTQVLNYLLNKRPTWENPEGHKMDAFIPPLAKGDRGLYLSPLSVQAELLHDLMRYGKQSGPVGAAGQIVQNKLGPGGQAARTLIFGTDWKGDQIEGSWNRVKQAGIELANPSPLLLRGTAQATKEGDSTPLERSVLSTLGFKTSPESQNEKRVREAKAETGLDIKEMSLGEREAQEKKFLSGRKPLSEDAKVSAAKQSIQKTEDRRKQIVAGLSEETRTFLNKHNLSPVSFQGWIGYKQGSEKTETKLYLTEEEQQALSDKITKRYEDYFHNMIPRLEKHDDATIQKAVTKDLAKEKKEAEQEQLKEMQESGFKMKRNGLKAFRQ